MRNTMMLAAVFLFVCLATAAVAKPPYVRIEQRLTEEQRHATGIDTLSAAQLELLNRLLDDEQAKVVERAVASTTAEPGPSLHAGLDDEPIKSRLKGDVSGWQPGTVFELENGQRWQVLKGEMTLRKPLRAPDILVVPGIAGRWFLQVDEDLPKARVFRID